MQKQWLSNGIFNFTTMRIDFDEILNGEISKAQLARDLVAAGHFRSFEAARNCIQYHGKGQMKSIDFELLQYLMERFNLTASQIIKP